MKVLITGCHGQLGRELVRQFRQINQRCKRFDLVATDARDLDITDTGQVKTLVTREQPKAIINTAAFTKVDACEREELKAFRVNVVGARNLSVAAYEIGAKVLRSLRITFLTEREARLSGNMTRLIR